MTLDDVLKLINNIDRKCEMCGPSVDCTQCELYGVMLSLEEPIDGITLQELIEEEDHEEVA